MHIRNVQMTGTADLVPIHICREKVHMRRYPEFNRRVFRLWLSITSISEFSASYKQNALIELIDSEQEHYRDSSSSNVDDR